MSEFAALQERIRAAAGSVAAQLPPEHHIASLITTVDLPHTELPVPDGDEARRRWASACQDLADALERLDAKVQTNPAAADGAAGRAVLDAFSALGDVAEEIG